MHTDGSEFDRLLLDQIADRWSILVLGAICAAGGTLRFNEVRRRIDGIAQRLSHKPCAGWSETASWSAGSSTPRRLASNIW